MRPEEFRGKLRGVIAFPITPFKPDLSLDLAGLRKNIQELLRHPIAAIVAAGGTGEMYSLTPAELLAVVKTIVEEVRGQIPVISGTGFNRQMAIELAQQSAQAGVDGILALPPYYPSADDEGLADYYASIGAATPLSLFVYSRDWVKPSPEWVEHLAARIPTLIAWKDGQGDTVRYKQIMDRVGDRLYWIGGAGDASVPAYYSIGIRTYTSSIATVAPKLSLRLDELASAGDSPALANLMSEYVNPLYAIRARRKGYEVSVMKEMMNLIGLAAGPVRPPLPNVRPQEIAELKAVLEKWRPFLSREDVETAALGCLAERSSAVRCVGKALSSFARPDSRGRLSPPDSGEGKPEGRMNQTTATRVRWKVLAWLCSLSALTYITRIGIIQVQDRIELDLHLTPQRLAYAFSAFSLAYALFEMPSGWLGDKLGPRKVLIRIVLVWTAFTALTGLAWGLISLIVFRFLFGAGEAGAFPNISRASREWFPFSERGFTQGMVWMCARWGGAVAPLLMMVLAYPFGWRGGFVLMSVLGAAWLWGFQSRYKDSPQSDAAVNAAERALITQGRKDAGKPTPLSWKTMLRSPTLWCLSVMYLCSNAGWSFFSSWITPYLRHDLRLSGIALVLASGAPLFFGGASCLLGGFLTDRQVRLGGPRWGRTLQGVIAYGLGGVFMLVSVALTPSHIPLAFASLCLSSFVKDFGMASSWATTIDIGHRYSGTVAGFMNMIGNLGQVVSIPVVAWLAVLAGRPGHPSWKVSLYFNAAMFFIAALSWLFVNPRRVIVYALAAEGEAGRAS